MSQDCALLHHVLEKSAHDYPKRIAVCDKTDVLTYTQLNDISDCLASALCAHGIQRGDRVALYTRKSAKAIAAVYAVLKAGAAYVPIPVNIPSYRALSILRDCECQAIVVDNAIVSSVLDKALAISPKLIVTTSKQRVPSVLPVINWQEVVQFPKTRSVERTTLTDSRVAYILYTSGSTGKPKGVVHTHRSALAFVNWAQEYFNIVPDDRIAGMTGLHFDLSTFDMFVTAKAAATVVLVSDGIRYLPTALVQFLAKAGITVIYTVPTVFKKWPAADNRYLLPADLRLLLFAGEVFPIKQLRQLYSLLPNVELYNMYGPTETNVCTVYQVQPDDVVAGRDRPVPIGKPCKYSSLFTINEQGEQVTLQEDAEGELCIGGDSVMTGYWNRPDSTASSFVRCGNKVGYRSGDIVRRDDEGNYIYVSRRDRMVKSRGYRIELDEIEHVLLLHETVREVAVVAYLEEDTCDQIHAFIVLDNYELNDTRLLMRHCLDYLPNYMLPQKMHVVDELPYNVNGKVDYRMLLRRVLTGSEK